MASYDRTGGSHFIWKCDLCHGRSAVYHAEWACNRRYYGHGPVFNRLWGIPVSLFVSIFNIAVFGLGLWQLGKEFALTTALSTVFYPAALAVMERTGIHGFYMEERLVAVIYAGILIGAGIGIVIKAGASTGGVEDRKSVV